MKSLVSRVRFLSILYFLTTLLFVLTGIAIALWSQIKPQQVIVVNEKGQIIGNMVLDDRLNRPDQSVISAVKNYVNHCYSLNASTILDDAAICLNSMTEIERETTIQLYTENKKFLQDIERSNSKSRIEFETVEILQKGDLVNQWIVRLSGKFLSGVSYSNVQNMVITANFSLAPVTTLNTYGIKDVSLSDNGLLLATGSGSGN